MKGEKTSMKPSNNKLPLVDDFLELFRKRLLLLKTDRQLKTAIEVLVSEVEPLLKKLPPKSNTFNDACTIFAVYAFDPEVLEKGYALQLYAHYFHDRIKDTETKVSIVMFLNGLLPYPNRHFLNKESAAEYLKIANNNYTIQMVGETGTGKELYAKTFHYLSNRRTKSFIPINCGGLDENTLLSELFGHTKGAFTGADKGKDGAIKYADHGTLFLDEIGDMTPKAQVALLRFLNDGKFQKLGETGRDIAVDVRIIAATNKDLKKEIKEGRFREDLYYRVNIIPFYLPTFRSNSERAIEQIIASKILPIVLHHQKANVGFASDQHRKVVVGFGNDIDFWIRQMHELISPEALKFLKNYPYPGNYRELENILRRSYLLSDGKIEIKHLYPDLFKLSSESTPETPLDSWMNLPYLEFTQKIKELHKKKVESALQETKGIVSLAARILGIKPHILRNKLIKELAINVDEFKK